MVAELASVHDLLAAATPGRRAVISLAPRSAATSPRPGLTVFPDAAPATDEAVVTQDGAQTTLAVLRDDSASPNVAFHVDGGQASLVVDQLGGVELLDTSGRALGRINAPWAYDAAGRSLPTNYTVSGRVLTQHVDTAGATFPVIADPHYTWGWVTGTVYFNKHETVAIAAGSGFLTAISAFAPPPFDVVFVTISAAATAYAGYLAGTGQCIKIKSNGSVGSYSGRSGDGYCR